MPLKQYSLRDLPSPFYRVATRVVILDEHKRILVLENHDGEYELPGGGWEFDETLELNLAREILEELGVAIDQVNPDILGVYRGRNPYGMTLRIVVSATLKSYDFEPVDMAHAWFVARDEFMKLDFKPTADEGMKDLADIIWSDV